MWRVTLSEQADRDLMEIGAWSRRSFGDAAARRYLRLVRTAFMDLGQVPERLGSRTMPGRPDLRLYPLLHSRDHAEPAAERVGRPRQFILYRLQPLRTVEVLRLLHDSMDIDQHVPSNDEP